MFSHDVAVLWPAADYLRVVGPVYAAMAITFVLAFASQGAGHVLWPFLAGTARLSIAAGAGWLAVRFFDASMPTLAGIVAVAMVVCGAICALAIKYGAAFRTPA